jgi:hypothetical protein
MASPSSKFSRTWHGASFRGSPVGGSEEKGFPYFPEEGDEENMARPPMRRTMSRWLGAGCKDDRDDHVANVSSDLYGAADLLEKTTIDISSPLDFAMRSPKGSRRPAIMY